MGYRGVDHAGNVETDSQIVVPAVVKTTSVTQVATTPVGQLPDRVRVTLLRGRTEVEERWLLLAADVRASWALPVLAPGTWTVRATVLDTPTLVRSQGSATVTVRKR